MENTVFVFVHGLSGWGSYDEAYRKMPYWGMRGGDLIAFLREKGFDCAAASVSPTGSAWDRACELYAQLAGKQADYGQVHSRTFGHARFGRDFSACPLIPEWTDRTRLVLLGHSFGGVTVRLLSELLAFGDRDEKETEQCSELFLGGMHRVKAVVTLAAPTNGTTAYDMFRDPGFDPETVKAPRWSRYAVRLMSRGTKARTDGRDSRDYAGYDMHIDRALEINRRIRTQEDVYYFSVPCSCTSKAEDGTWVPEKKLVEPLYYLRSAQMGAYSGKTQGGVEIGDVWRENDGLVNTCSARSPAGEPEKELDRDHIPKGVWNVFPTFHGDHMALQGGLLRRRDIRPFYLEMLEMIRALP